AVPRGAAVIEEDQAGPGRARVEAVLGGGQYGAVALELLERVAAQGAEAPEREPPLRRNVAGADADEAAQEQRLARGEDMGGPRLADATAEIEVAPEPGSRHLQAGLDPRLLLALEGGAVGIAHQERVALVGPA